MALQAITIKAYFLVVIYNQGDVSSHTIYSVDVKGLGFINKVQLLQFNI